MQAMCNSQKGESNVQQSKRGVLRQALHNSQKAAHAMPMANGGCGFKRPAKMVQAHAMLGVLILMT